MNMIINFNLRSRVLIVRRTITEESGLSALKVG